MRLDQYLVANELAKSRNEAVKMIADNLVYVDNKVVNKNNFIITNENVEILGHLKFVSRGGLKLEHGLHVFGINVEGMIVLDLGSSTGGFADVCLQAGAKHIYCVDAGCNQLHDKIKNNSKVTNLEKTNVKNLNSEIIQDQIDLVVSDLSFISSKYMFQSLAHLKLKNGCNIISLIKPQFELSKSIVDNCKAKITNSKHHQQAIENVKKYASDANLKIISVIDSIITGAKKQNKEFLIWCIYEK